MSTRRPLPTEIFAQIFTHLTRQDLHHCLLVSHHWYAQAEPWLYGNNVIINPAFQRTHASLIQTLKTRKHLLRKVEWQSHYHGGEVLVPEDLLDVFLDYRPPPPPPVDDNKCDDGLGAEVGATTTATQQRLRTMIATSSAVPGPNRPSLTHFSFVGVDHFGCLLNMILFNLTMANLTTLELHLVGCGTDKIYSADIARILNTFVYLKNLSITGNVVRYLPPPEVKGDSWQHDDTDSLPFSETTAPATTTTNPATQSHQLYRLETFAFDRRLLVKDGTDLHAFFKRLGNLKRIQIRSSVNYFDGFSYCSPWVVGQTLNRCCPQLEAIETWGPVALWFFDLPILPSDKIPHLTALAQESSVLPEEGWIFATESFMRGSWLERRLQGQEVDELLIEGKGLVSHFPRLKSLILGQDHSLGAQDLILLGLQARFLTHVEIYHRPVDLRFVWDMYDKDAAEVADALTNSTTTTTTVASTNNAILENRRLRKRWRVGTREILLFLQHCSSLRYFSLTGHAIEGLIQCSSGDETGETPAAERFSFIEPWACEKTLETLTIGFDMSYNPSMDHHALVWKHLGRFKKLRSLALPLSTLIPSPAYGVEGLLTGGGRLNETLEEIRSLPSWWKVDDRKEMVLWLARSCPRLRVLGLEHTKLRDAGGWSFSSFVGDEDVRGCSIRRVFIESAFF